MGACVLWKVITTSATLPILLSQLSLIIVTTRENANIADTADIGPGVTCDNVAKRDNWAVTGQRGSHPNPLSRPDQARQPALYTGFKPSLANEILICFTRHICRSYLWFLSKKAELSPVQSSIKS